MRFDQDQAWIKSRNLATQRFAKFGGYSFLVALAIIAVQSLIWIGAGWGSANFLPLWLLTLIYCYAFAVGLSLAYITLALSAAREGRIRWGWSIVLGATSMGFALMAFAHSVPQLSTLLVSSPQEVTLRIHDSRISVTGSGRPGKRICRTNIQFGPIYAFRGGWCGVYISPGQTYTFRGRGNALAIRLDQIVKE